MSLATPANRNPSVLKSFRTSCRFRRRMRRKNSDSGSVTAYSRKASCSAVNRLDVKFRLKPYTSHRRPSIATMTENSAALKTSGVTTSGTKSVKIPPSMTHSTMRKKQWSRPWKQSKVSYSQTPTAALFISWSKSSKCRKQATLWLN